MAVQYIALLPIIIMLWFPITFVTTYIIAVLREDVNPIFPYISDTGTFSPESCIFGQMLNMGAIYMALFTYFRYKAVNDICIKYSLSKLIYTRNLTSLYYGLVAAFGIMIVGNFQETNIFVVHLIGAFLAFGLGNIWQCYQTWISFKLYPIVGQPCNINTRLALTIIGGITVNVSFVFAVLSIINFKGSDITKWKEEDGGYKYHLVSTVTEWIVAICTMLYVVTFVSEFKQITMEPIEVSVKESMVNNINNVQNISDSRQRDRTTYNRY